MPTVLIRDLEGLKSRPSSPTLRTMRGHALQILMVGLESVDPARAMATRVRRAGRGLLIDGSEVDLERYEAVRLLAFGKAAPAMARYLSGLVDFQEGLVVTDRPDPVPGMGFRRGGHPIPDADSLEAGDAALEMAARCGPRDLLLVLVSGGGSSMLEATDISLEDLQRTNELLLRCGADIGELNTVRKHLSRLKGGQLAVQATGRGGEVITLAISDVVGDDPSMIASGPTVPDPTTFSDARRVLHRYRLWEEVPEAVRRRIDAGLRGRIPETPKPGHEAFDRARYVVVASNRVACLAAQEEARRLGYEAMILTTRLQGEAREVARVLTAVALSVEDHGHPLEKPAAIIAGGETTVTVRGGGEGGRNQELVLACLRDIGGRDIVVLSCGTDGVDGGTEAAGAIADGESCARAEAAGLDPESHLQENDSFGFFKGVGDTIITGPTGTNVMDLQVLLVGCPGRGSRDP